MLKFVNHIWDKLFVKQWSVGLAYGSPEVVLNDGFNNLEFKWIPIADNGRFLADPFIVRKSNGDVVLFCEDFHYNEQNGKISAFLLSENFEIKQHHVILDTGSHLSYPAIYHFEGSYYLIPESGLTNQLVAYEINLDLLKIKSSQVIHHDEPLLDATLLAINNQCWMFVTKRGPDSNRALYMYHSLKWNGPFSQIGVAPIANHLSGSRPAGHFFSVEGKLYRPAQNSQEYYGKSIIINELEFISEIYSGKTYKRVEAYSKFCL